MNLVFVLPFFEYLDTRNGKKPKEHDIIPTFSVDVVTLLYLDVGNM